MNQCLICHNKTEEQSGYKTICSGCLSLLSHPDIDCQQCGVTLQTRHALCGSCQKFPPSFSRVQYACIYQSPIDVWVKALKFGKNIMMSRLFAELLLPMLESIDAKYVLMPVPLHVSRLRKRGYNQAYEIAKEMAKYTQRKLDTSLKRSKNTQMQALLKLNQRAKNVNKAFSLLDDVKNRYIILVDDVMTSGNTLKECAKTLVKAGAKDVKVLVFARKSL